MYSACYRGYRLVSVAQIFLASAGPRVSLDYLKQTWSVEISRLSKYYEKCKRVNLQPNNNNPVFIRKPIVYIVKLVLF